VSVIKISSTKKKKGKSYSRGENEHHDDVSKKGLFLRSSNVSCRKKSERIGEKSCGDKEEGTDAVSASCPELPDKTAKKNEKDR